jgi:linoleate 10R-lipoxygenase
MTRAVLGDAIAMVRGDRFNTTNFTRPFLTSCAPDHKSDRLCAATALTAWGYNDCRRDPHNGGWGGERGFAEMAEYRC